MIIWIDGVNGVGKSHVAAGLAEQLRDKNAEYVESDIYWMELIKEDFGKALSGFNPYVNRFFLEKLRNVIQEKYEAGKTPVVSMTLASKLCEIELLDYFNARNVQMFHIILDASKETIISRIEKDLIRDSSAQNQQKSNIDWQIDYLEKMYAKALRISSDSKSIDDIIQEIIMLINL